MTSKDQQVTKTYSARLTRKVFPKSALLKEKLDELIFKFIH